MHGKIHSCCFLFVEKIYYILETCILPLTRGWIPHVWSPPSCEREDTCMFPKHVILSYLWWDLGEALKMCLVNFTLLFFFFYLWCSSIPSKWAERQKRYEKIDSFLVPEWGSFVKVVWAQIFLFIFKIK